MAVGDTITALRYNALQTRIAGIMGTGTGQSGYGQTLTTGNAQVAIGSIITVTSMNGLMADMQRARQHQLGTDQSANFPQVASANTILELSYSNLESQMTLIENDKFSIGGPGTAQSTTTTISSSVRTTAWDATITHSVTIDFGSATAARHFFNAGGKINTRASLSGYTGTAGTDWFNMLADMGTVSMNHTATTGSGTTSTIGFYDLTTSNQQIFSKVGTTFTGNNYTVFARCDVASNTNGTARYVYLDIRFNDADSGNSSAITGTITSFVEALTPTGTNVSLTAPTATATANLADAAAPANYTITVRGGQNTVAEGNQVIFDVTTTTGETTLYWTTTGTVTAADFSDNTLSGSITMVNGASAISRTLVVEGAQYSLTPSTTSVNEGSSVTITVNTTNVINGTVLYWGTEAVTGTINASDFNDSTLVGSVTINSNTATITRTLSSDVSFNEGAESFTIKLYTDSGRTTTVATTSTITINDTSARTYSMSVSSSSVNEGSSVTITVTTTNVANGTVLYWNTLNTQGTLNNSDFSDSTTIGTVTINSNTGTISRTLRNDTTTEGTEAFAIRLYDDTGRTNLLATSPTISVSDTSLTPPTAPPPTSPPPVPPPTSPPPTSPPPTLPPPTTQVTPTISSFSWFPTSTSSTPANSVLTWSTSGASRVLVQVSGVNGGGFTNYDNRPASGSLSFSGTFPAGESWEAILNLFNAGGDVVAQRSASFRLVWNEVISPTVFSGNTPVNIVISGGKPNTNFSYVGNLGQTGSATLNSSGSYTISGVVFPPGNYTFTFTFSGSGNTRNVLFTAL